MLRGWTFQERLLSPRLVHFTAGEVMWECCEISCCQCPPTYQMGEEVSPYISSPRRHYLKQHQRKILEHSGLFSTRKGAYWRDLVTAFCQLDLTLEKDKLPALSGIAKREQLRRGGDQYLAGVWRSTLLYDIQWYLSEKHPDRSQPVDKWRAPTWSWAARNGSVAFVDDSDYGRICCAVTEVSITLDGTDPTGGVLSGYLVLSGPVAVAAISNLMTNSGSLARNESSVHFYLDSRHEAHGDIDGELSVGDSLTCLQVTHCRGSLSEYYFCLVLRRKQGADANENPSVYERVGSIFVDDPTSVFQFCQFSQNMVDTVVKIV